MRMNDVTNTIINKIKAGEITMKPRWHFLLRSLLMVLGGLFFVLLLMYIVSFIVFIVRFSGAAFVPGFGGAGLIALLLAIPWLLVLLALLFVVVLEVLVQRFSVTRQTPLLYSILGVVVISFIGSYILLQTPLHSAIQTLATERQAPLVGPLYRTYGDQLPGRITPGVITVVTDGGFMLMTRNGDMWQINLSSETRGVDMVEIAPDVAVVVLGERDGNMITAAGIKTLPDDVRPPRRGGGRDHESRLDR